MVSPTAAPASSRIGAGTVLLIGTWIGLIAGFFDVCILVMNTKFIRRDFFRLGGDFPWIVPSAVAFSSLVPAGAPRTAREDSGADTAGRAGRNSFVHRIP